MSYSLQRFDFGDNSCYTDQVTIPKSKFSLFFHSTGDYKSDSIFVQLVGGNTNKRVIASVIGPNNTEDTIIIPKLLFPLEETSVSMKRVDLEQLTSMTIVPSNKECYFIEDILNIIKSQLRFARSVYEGMEFSVNVITDKRVGLLKKATFLVKSTVPKNEAYISLRDVEYTIHYDPVDAKNMEIEDSVYSFVDDLDKASQSDKSESPSDNDATKQKCQFCGNSVNTKNFQMHQIQCKKVNMVCPTCHKVLLVKNYEKHQETHTFISCPFCKYRVARCDLLKHIGEDGSCEKKTEKCRKCGMYFPSNELKTHKFLCDMGINESEEYIKQESTKIGGEVKEEKIER
ncbi:hypothetical protein EIN_031750, partial [Entamoeba invadens IP1]